MATLSTGSSATKPVMYFECAMHARGKHVIQISSMFVMPYLRIRLNHRVDYSRHLPVDDERGNFHRSSNRLILLNVEYL